MQERVVTDVPKTGRSVDAGKEDRGVGRKRGLGQRTESAIKL